MSCRGTPVGVPYFSNSIGELEGQACSSSLCIVQIQINAKAILGLLTKVQKVDKFEDSKCSRDLESCLPSSGKSGCQGAI